MPVYLADEGGYLLFIHIHLYYLVHHSIELFGADFLRCGYLASHKLLAYDALYIAHLTAFA